MKFDERVLLNELRLTDTDDQIVEYITADRERFIKQSVQKTAEDLFTVPNTIVRFAKKVGYNGVSYLKYSLKEESRDIKRKDEIVNVDLIPETITKSLELVNEEIINEIVDKIMDAKNIYFLGIGDSIYFCETFAKNIRCTGIKAEHFNHRHDMIYAAENCTEKDLFIAISVSGESKQILDISRVGKKRNATIVSMTHFSKNSLMEIADINLFYWAPKVEVHNYNATDRVGIMMLIRMINEKLWIRCV